MVVLTRIFVLLMVTSFSELDVGRAVRGTAVDGNLVAEVA